MNVYAVDSDSSPSRPLPVSRTPPEAQLLATCRDPPLVPARYIATPSSSQGQRSMHGRLNIKTIAQKGKKRFNSPAPVLLCCEADTAGKRETRARDWTRSHQGLAAMASLAISAAGA